MIHQSPPRRRPMAVKVPATLDSPRRPVLRLRWSWLLLAALIILVGLAALVVAHGGVPYKSL